MSTPQKSPASSKPAAAKTKVELKPVARVRVRCDCDHKVPWLNRLYVLWAAAPADSVPIAASKDAPRKDAPPTDQPKPPPPPQYHLAQSDSQGYLSPAANEFDPKPGNTLPIFEGAKYLFYFVRHPAKDLPTEIQRKLNAGKGKDEFGDPIDMVMKLVVTGKDAKKKDIKELVIRLGEHPSWFIPSGSDFYDGWTLFRGMPNDQCDSVIHQVRRLQHHLGALRYPIGGHGHPYSPARLFPKTPDQYAHDGEFEVVTWNSVLAFQRDAAAGVAAQLVSADALGKFLDVDNDFEPLPEASDALHHIKRSHDFIDANDISVDAVPIRSETVVDKATGDAILAYLSGGLRKPGPVLISYVENDKDSQGYDRWMDSRVLPDFNRWSSRLQAFGFPKGVRVNGVLRDVRIGVGGGNGQISTSLHKSGFALDLDALVGGAKSEGKPDYPLFYIRDPAVTTRPQWIVFAKVENNKLPAHLVDLKDAAGNVIGKKSPKPDESDIQVLASIDNWVYDATHPDGGTSVPLSIPGFSFLNVTRIANAIGFTNISGHKGKFERKKDPLSLTISNPDTFGQFLSRLKEHIDQLKSKLAPGVAVTINGASTPVATIAGEVPFYEFWHQLGTPYGHTPAVTVDPTNKLGEAFIKDVKSKVPASKFSGRQFHIKYIPAKSDKKDSEKTKEEKNPGEETIPIKSDTPFKGPLQFVIRPIFSPDLDTGATIDFPALSGNPFDMEWWHFQLEKMYQGKKWGPLLREIGWTAEGLLGKSGHQPIFDFFGVGYTTRDLAADAR